MLGFRARLVEVRVRVSLKRVQLEILRDAVHAWTSVRVGARVRLGLGKGLGLGQGFG